MIELIWRTLQAQRRMAQAGAVLTVAALVAGCGSVYRPVITPVTTTGPAAQPSGYAVVVSSPSPTVAGIATIIDYSGDTVQAYAPVGVGPFTFSTDSGSYVYTINGDETLTNFPFSSTLQAKNVQYSSLSTNSVPVNLFSPGINLYALDQYQNTVDVLSGSPQAFKQTVPVATTPVTMVGASGAARYYAISQVIPYGNGVACNNNPSSLTTNGEADAIELTTLTVSTRIPTGVCPVYAVGTTDNRRVFVLNRGSDSITVINSQNNTLDSCAPFDNQNGQLVTCHPSIPLSKKACATCANLPATAGPVYAEYNATTGQLVVADYDGNAISIIDVSLDEYGNDSSTFGTTYTVPISDPANPTVSAHPAAVTVLPDGSRAYVANQEDATVTNGSVTIVNMSSHTIEKTLSLPESGHPRTVVSVANSLYGKVYVVAPDSPYLTIVRTDEDVLDTTVLVQGNILDVRTNTQNGIGSNANTVSRSPGLGQPCLTPVFNPSSLGACQTQ